MAIGKCVGCKCVKNGVFCVDCYPSRQGRCENQCSTDVPAVSSAVPSPPSASGRSNIHTSVSVAASAISDQEVNPLPSESILNSDQQSRNAHVHLHHLVNNMCHNGGIVAATPVPELPPFLPVSPPDFTWGSLSGQECLTSINNCYQIIVHWNRNLFKVPTGNAGKAFVQELVRLFKSYTNNSALESVALKATFVFPSLMLRKSHRRSKTPEHISHLLRRLDLWKNGLFDQLLKEGCEIQRQLPKGI
jgi:hypothetical protein